MIENDVKGEQNHDLQHVTQLLGALHAFHTTDRDRAIEALCTLGIDPAFAALSALLATADTNLRGDAAEAAVRIDSQRGIGLILPLLHDPDPTIRWNICGLLHDFGDERAIEPLMHTLRHDPDSQVRLTAAYALEALGDVRALPALRWAQAHDHGIDYEGRTVSESATDAIAAIEARAETAH
jgi:HEAT repeat protein